MREIRRIEHIDSPISSQIPADIVVVGEHKNLTMLGAGGIARELAAVKDVDFQGKLPVLLGAGLGHALQYLLDNTEGPVAVVDKECDIQAHSGVRKRFTQEYIGDAAMRILWIESTDTQEVLNALTRWQISHASLPFALALHTFYMRLDKEWYGQIREHVTASEECDFWAHVRKPRFTNKKPRVLLITSKYFLLGELVLACERAGIEHKLLALQDEEMSRSDFVESLLKIVVDFQPDCLLTMNHLGVDREGVLMNLLAQLQLPLASWFVDNPHLIVHSYTNLKNPWVTLFTWDADNVASLQEIGFEHVFYLPLGTDTERFHPQNTGNPSWRTKLSFVGNSMVHKVTKVLGRNALPQKLLTPFMRISADFNASSERSVETFLQNSYPKYYNYYCELPNNELRLGYETAITWEATRLYRAQCVEQILPFSPLIVGDDGWQSVFPKKTLRLIPPITYYDDLPLFYPLSDINFNATSKQMKGAVNQRIFDVPACNAFVLTDWREQMDALFEPKKEIISYTEPEEIPELISYYLAHPKERQSIASAARKRVLAEHTWEHRLRVLLAHMRDVYGTAF